MTATPVACCERFPVSCAADAVRFSVTSEQPCAYPYILEKDYAPLEAWRAGCKLIRPQPDSGGAGARFPP